VRKNEFIESINLRWKNRISARNAVYEIKKLHLISMVSVGLRQLVSNNILALHTLPIKMIGMSKVIPIKMNDADALSILHGCVANDSRVFISPHAKERMLERNITLKQVLACIEKGRITESPYRDVRGDWRCSIEHYTSGNAVTVAIAFKYNNSGERIVVVTVF